MRFLFMFCINKHGTAVMDFRTYKFTFSVCIHVNYYIFCAKVTWICDNVFIPITSVCEKASTCHGETGVFVCVCVCVWGAAGGAGDSHTRSLFLTYGGEKDSEGDKSGDKRKRQGEKTRSRVESARKEISGEMPAGRMDYILPELYEPL